MGLGFRFLEKISELGFEGRKRIEIWEISELGFEGRKRIEIWVLGEGEG